MKRLGLLVDSLASRPLSVVFMAALLPRIILAVVVRFRFDGYLYLDDRSYLEAFERYAASGGTEKPAIWDSVPSYSRPISLFFRFVYDDPLTALIPTAIAGSLSAVFVAIAIGQFTNNRRALLAGLMVAWWPSQVFWSSLALRDAFIWMAVSSIFAASSFLRPTRSRLAVTGASTYILSAIVCIAGSRRHSALAVALAAVIALLVYYRRRTVLAVAALLAVLAPMALGFGPAGWSLWKEGTASVSANRQREVNAAETPIQCWNLPILPSGDESQGGWRDDLLCLPTSATSFLMAPFPRQVNDNPSLVPPFLELPAWIALYILSLRRLRDRPTNPGLIAARSYVVITVMMWSLIDRVVGTGFRHRGEILAPLVILIMAGSQRRGEESRPY